MDERYSLENVDGNVFMVMGYVTKAMKREGFKSADIDAYRARATSGDYDNALQESFKQLDLVNKRAQQEA